MGIREIIQKVSLIVFAFLAFTGDRSLYLILNDYIKLPGGTYRAFTLLSLVLFFIYSRKRSNLIPEILLLCFSFFYISRLFIEILVDNPYHISPLLVLVNFLLGTILPFILIGRVSFTQYQYNLIYKTFIYGGLLFGVLIFNYYGKYIGEVERISTITTGDADVIGPLDMAYISSMIIGVTLFYLYGNKVTIKNVLISLCVIAINIVPFFLGASRGAFLSILFALLVIVLSKPSVKVLLKVLCTVSFLMLLVYHLTDNLGDGLISRINDIGESRSTGGEANLRITIWKQALSQFESSPIIGHGLQTKGILMYPHNLFIETLLTTGVLGFIPMLLLIFLAFRKSVKIIRTRKEYIWIVALFLICFVQSMFSFSIYSNKWFWIASALLFTIKTKTSIIHKQPINYSVL